MAAPHLPSRARVVVVGGGVIGSSVAYHLAHMGWKDVARLIEDAFATTIQQGKVTYDLERLMVGATKLKTSEFAKAIVENM